MNKIEHKYEQCGVRIESNGIIGSGCIIQPANSNYTFLFTAKHCLTNNAEIDLTKIGVTGSSQLNEASIKIIDIFIDDDNDIAVIQIERIGFIETTSFSRPKKDLQVNLFGFPGLLNGESQILACKISFDHDNFSDIELLQSQITFEKSAYDTIAGFSGSGIFFETASGVYVIGILTKLKAIDGAYNTVCAYHIDIFDRLITSKGLPSLFQDNVNSIIKDYSFSFANYNSALEKHYLVRAIDEHFNSSLMSPKNIWISGEPGVGKTLLIQRNLNKNGNNFILIDLTTSKLDDVNGYFEIINHEIINQRQINVSSNGNNIYDHIANNLNQINNQENLILFVDEIPIRDGEIFSKFLAGFIKISEKYSNSSFDRKQIKWIISTRMNPDGYISELNDCLIDGHKAVKHFLFKFLDYWTYQELDSLIELLGMNLNFSLSVHTKEKMIRMCKGIPNPLKRVIELVLLDNRQVEDALEIVKSEYH